MIQHRDETAAGHGPGKQKLVIAAYALVLLAVPAFAFAFLDLNFGSLFDETPPSAVAGEGRPVANSPFGRIINNWEYTTHCTGTASANCGNCLGTAPGCSALGACDTLTGSCGTNPNLQGCCSGF